MAKSPLRGGLWFLSAVVILYGIACGVDAESTGHALGRSMALLTRLFPVLGIVVAVLLLSNLALRGEWVRAHLGARSGARAWFLAGAGGILAAGPIYPWYALLGELREKGMRTGLISVFLYTRAIKLPLVPLLIHYFGLAYSLTLCGYLILFSFPAGLMLERLVGNSNSMPPPLAQHREMGGQEDDL
jgi:hypothetical protein